MSGRKEPLLSGRDKIAFVLILVVVLGEAALFTTRAFRGDREGDSASPPTATLDLGETLGGDTAGFARALEPRPFVFPEDHAAHPGFRTEWWYVTSNLETAEGRRFGVHFTIFRNALTPPDEAMRGVSGDGDSAISLNAASENAAPGSSPSEWATNQVYMGHFAVADVEGEGFLEAERFTRGAAGLAGAEAFPLRVWMDEWSLEDADPADEEIFPLRMRASEEREGTPVVVDLRMEPLKPLVLQGDRGLSQKGAEPGNASFYYSYTRLRTEGTITVGDEVFAVAGSSWLDREWSTSALDESQAGWDWFALQLNDGRDLMVYRLRGKDGSTDPLSEGVLVAPDGSARRLGVDDFELEVLDSWTSPVDGAVYPSTWRVQVDPAATGGESIDLVVRPVLRDQEMNVTVRYWEGAVDLLAVGADGEAARGSTPLGRGYVELTGYAGATPPGG